MNSRDHKDVRYCSSALQWWPRSGRLRAVPPARYSGSTEHRSAVEQDRRGYGRRVGSLPGRGRGLHELHGDSCLRRGRRHRGRLRAYGPGVSAPAGASVDCAVVEAAYRTLIHYFPSNAALVTNLNGYYSDALSNLNGCTADGGEGTSCRIGCREQHHRPSYGRWAHDPDWYDVAVRDEEPRPRSVASHSAIRRPTDAMARVGATVSAEEPWSVSDGAADPTYEPAVGSGFNEVKAYGGQGITRLEPRSRLRSRGSGQRT